MTEKVTVTAVYEEGVLRPVQRLNLREKQTVRIEILQEPSESLGTEAEAEEEMNHILQTLEQAGILSPPPGDSDAESMSDQARRELAEELGRAPGKPLSEIIIEDRGEW